mgnify:CR=1 FL=1
MSNADSNPTQTFVLEAMRHKPIPDAIADLAEIAAHLVAAHEDDGSTGNHGKFLIGMMLKDNLELLSERARIKPAT